jgi:deoxyribodipyrimidine photo-lyase
MGMNCTLLWFRIDLRLADNPALHHALASGAVVPVFIWDPESEEPWSPGGATRWWLHQSLAALGESLRAMGSRLVIRRGPVLETLLAVAKEAGANAVAWSRRYEPAVIARDSRLKESLRTAGLEAESFAAALLHEPHTVENKSGNPFQVFTPFWKHCLAKVDPDEPLPAPDHLPGPANWPESLPLSALELEPKIDWAGGFRAAWTPGEAGAMARLERFLGGAGRHYGAARDIPGIEGTSRLSPHLHFGEISPRQIWHAARRSGLPGWRESRYITEVGWREFAHHLLYHFPNTTSEPLRKEFARFPWKENAALLKAWQRGMTGYPIVDAGMRELWATGWMHNRVRMIVASFLVKDLLISWTEGAAWFWDTLVDADLAQNTLGWQWTAGCGADAAPYFRVFNPSGQGEKFDPDGAYVRRWCPELARVPKEWLHRPWEAPFDTLAAAGVVLGRQYPRPIVDHGAARNFALDAFATLKAQADA